MGHPMPSRKGKPPPYSRGGGFFTRPRMAWLYPLLQRAWLCISPAKYTRKRFACAQPPQGRLARPLKAVYPTLCIFYWQKPLHPPFSVDSALLF